MRGHAPKRRTRMGIQKIVEQAKDGLIGITNFTVSSVVGISKREDGWHVGIELIERKAIPDTQDLLGVYEITLNDAGEIVTYERKRVRRRMDTEIEA
ncbi:MAG: gas vesicle protein [Nitrospinae bacterium]|nr:gas vesicle protein [Nitrospinota bacterium]